MNLNMGGAIGQALTPFLPRGGGGMMPMMGGSAMGNVAGGLMQAWQGGTQYTPESLVQDALTGARAGFSQYMNPSTGFSSNVGPAQNMASDARTAPAGRIRYGHGNMPPQGQVTVNTREMQQAPMDFSGSQFMQNMMSAWERFGG